MVNDEAAARSPYLKALLEAGFVKGYKDLEYYPSLASRV
jgi:hypothetical protein